MAGFKKSPWIIHYDASSCNGCDIETLACLTPLYDVERLEVVNTGNPKHADIFLVTGAVNEQSREVIRNIYHQLPEPKVVVAVGVCASSGGIFRECYNVAGGVDSVIPVDVYVPGCAARPEAIRDPPRCRDQHGHSQRIPHHHRLHAQRTLAQALRHGRQRGIDDGRVQRLHEEADGHQPQQHFLGGFLMHGLQSFPSETNGPMKKPPEGG